MAFLSKKSDDSIVARLTAHQAEILAYICSLLPGDAAVNDILQRTNLVLWKKRATFEKGSNFRAWAFSIARWEVKAFLKEKNRKSWLVIDGDLAHRITETMVSTTEQNPMSELRPALELCLKKLKPEERELITQRYHSDSTLKDYAAKSGRSPGSIRVTLCRIRATLKRCIEARQAMEKAKQAS